MEAMSQADWLLYRAFATVEDTCSTPGWQKDIRTGYEVSRPLRPVRTLSDRLGADGARRRDLRNRLDPFWFAVLEIRYGDDLEKIERAWRSIAVHIAQDKRLVKTLRDDRQALQNWMVWFVRHPDLRHPDRRPESSSVGKTWRWRQDCSAVAEDWVYPAEDAAIRVLQDRGELR